MNMNKVGSYSSIDATDHPTLIVVYYCPIHLMKACKRVDEQTDGKNAEVPKLDNLTKQMRMRFHYYYYYSLHLLRNNKEKKERKKKNNIL